MADDKALCKNIKTGDVEKVKAYLTDHPHKVKTCNYDIMGAIGYSIECGSKCDGVTKYLFNKFKSQKFPVGSSETGKTVNVPLSEHHETMQGWICSFLADETRSDIFKYFLAKYSGENVGEILTAVCSNGNAKCLSICFSRNNAERFDQNALDNGLIAASVVDSLPCARFLIRKGANPGVPNAEGVTAFSACITNESGTMAKALCKALPKVAPSSKPIPAGVSKTMKSRAK